MNKEVKVGSLYKIKQHFSHRELFGICIAANQERVVGSIFKESIIVHEFLTEKGVCQFIDYDDKLKCEFIKLL